MIDALCGFAALLRRHGGDVGSAELVDAARALALVDLADRSAVRAAVTLTIAWSATDPDRFRALFDEWFDGRDVELIDAAADAAEPAARGAIALDADTWDAARIHTDEAAAVEASAAGGSATADRAAPPSRMSSPARVAPDGDQDVAGTGEFAPAPPRDDATGASMRDRATVQLPEAPPGASLELARAALAAAAERRRVATSAAVVAARPVTTVVDALATTERLRLDRAVRALDRRLDGASSWRRARSTRGTVDLRRTLRASVTSNGVPIAVRRAGRRDDSARLLVLVDLSMSVRGTARLVLHLVHRMRTMQGSMRAFGFIDSAVALDRALRVADPVVAIGNVLALVDVGAASDPGAALRQWWTRWSYLVHPSTHVMILGDGRCNGHDPAFEIVERITRRSSSTTWISPEPRGAWTLGRGEMERYARCVDQAVSVRSLDDLDRAVGVGQP
ncbi:MAG: VWA domain-containing protein [Ilumatobacteraceae bacterium]